MTTTASRTAIYLSAGICLTGTQSKATLMLTLPGDLNSLHLAGLKLAADQTSILASGYLSTTNGAAASRFRRGASLAYFTQGDDLTGTTLTAGWYAYWNNSSSGAISGSDNYALIDFDRSVNGFESVGQFDLNLISGEAELIAIVTDSDGSITISEGYAYLNAVPEPSGALLSLLALGATACSRRRARAVRR